MTKKSNSAFSSSFLLIFNFVTSKKDMIQLYVTNTAQSECIVKGSLSLAGISNSNINANAKFWIVNFKNDVESVTHKFHECCLFTILLF